MRSILGKCLHPNQKNAMNCSELVKLFEKNTFFHRNTETELCNEKDENLTSLFHSQKIDSISTARLIQF